MEDIQIYELAGNVLGGITRDLNEGIYAELGGDLSLFWGSEEIYGAYASSLGQSDKPPKHSITVYYEFARQVWRDAEHCCKFLRNIPEGSGVDKIYDFWSDRAKLPICSNDEQLVRNMFVAAITWVYFHELGHLIQEHGVIRYEFGPMRDEAKQTTDVHDCQALQDEPINGREALVSHVTELAADFEATSFYVMELIRHCINPDFVDDQARPEVFSDLLYLMVCGISLVFFRFNGNKPIFPIAAVEGSHPKPLTRLELLLHQIYDKLDQDIFRTGLGHALDRRQLVLLCTKAAFSATLYWSMTNTENHKFDVRFILKGIFSSPATLQYLQPIVGIWDEMLPRIKELYRFDLPHGLMNFTDTFRARISGVITWGNGPEANAPATALSPPDATTS